MGFVPTAQSDTTAFAGLADAERGLYGIQFHPEVAHTPARPRDPAQLRGRDRGRRADLDAGLLRRDHRGRDPRSGSATGQVICALSGGVDSAVAATLVHRAIGDQLTCIYVDHGLMRKRESELLRATFAENFGHEAGHGRRAGPVPPTPGGRGGSGGEAPHHRRRVHPRLRGGGGQAWARSTSWRRAPSTPMSSSRRPPRPRRRPRSRPTTTSAACRPTCASA